jgi:hypothetical protein
MTRLGFDGFGVGSGAEHSKDVAGLGMRWVLITRRGLGLGLGLVGGGDGDGDGGDWVGCVFFL